MVKNVQQIAVAIFIVTVAVLTIIGILAIWDMIGYDALYRSISTMFFVGFSALIVWIAAQYLEIK